MTTEKKLFPEIKFYMGAKAPGFSLKRKWFLYFQGPTGRIKVYGKINSFDTYEQRMQEIERLKNEIFADHIPPHTIPQVLRDKLASKNYTKKKTIQTFESKLNVLFNFLGNREVNRKNMELFFDELNKKHPSTFNAYRVFLKMIFKDVHLSHLLPDIKRKKAKRTPARYFQTYHIKRLKNYIKEKDLKLLLFIQLMYYCALRPNEIRHIRAGDILLDDGRIYIRGEDSKSTEMNYAYIPDQLTDQLEFIKALDEKEYIFHSRLSTDQPCSVNLYASKHQKMLKYLGFNVREYKLYSWRHTAAVNLLKSGWSVKQIQLHYRHSSIEVTDQYLRQLKIADFDHIRDQFPNM